MTSEPSIDAEAFKKFEREGYSRVAQGYDRATAMVTSQVNDAVLDAVGAGPGVPLLEVACGPGWLSAAAVKRGAIVTALDFAENMVAIARLRCPEADIHNADAENLPFQAGRFDAVVCSLGILHLPNPRASYCRGLSSAQIGRPLRLHMLDAAGTQPVLWPRPRLGATARRHECEPPCRTALVSLWRPHRV